MKFLVVFVGLLALALSLPIDIGYETPLGKPLVVENEKPLEDINLPVAVGPALVEPVVRNVPFPFVPAQVIAQTPIVRTVQQAQIVPVPNGIPFGTHVTIPAPVASPVAVARTIPAPVPLQFAAPTPVAVARTIPVPAPVAIAKTVPAPVPFAAPAPAPVPLSLATPLPVPFATPVQGAVPVPLAATVQGAVPVPLAAPVPAPSSQFHAQDEAGGFNFGYADLNSVKNEVRTPDGVTRGFYEYIDPNNQVQRVEYIADPLLGFRVAGTNIPVAQESPAVVIEDTPEVAEAKAEFKKAFDAALARSQAALAAVESEEANQIDA